MHNYRDALCRLYDSSSFPEGAFFIEDQLKGRPIIVYGAGECSHWFVEIVMKMHGCVPIAVLDQCFVGGGNFAGVPAFSPADYQPTDAERKEAIVVICVGNRDYHPDIVHLLKTMGYQKLLFLMDVYEVHNPFSLPQDLARKGFTFFLENRDRAMGALDLLGDDLSRDIYVKCMQTHMTRRPVPLPMRPRKEQYFPLDLKLSRGYSRFVSCGSYDGDSIRLLNELAGKVDAITCFEPEPAIYKRLTTYLSQFADHLATTIVAFPCAVFSHEAIISFSSASGLGSRIAHDGDSLVQSVSLDRALAGFSPTFICMDIEGVELEALRGAEALLRRSAPDLAVCVYHAPHHLWEVPLYLDGLGLGYRLYLRNYTSFTAETVLYATV